MHKEFCRKYEERKREVARAGARETTVGAAGYGVARDGRFDSEGSWHEEV